MRIIWLYVIIYVYVNVIEIIYSYELTRNEITMSYFYGTKSK